jgi:hypothetical protein
MKLPSFKTLWRGATLQRDFEELRDVFVRYIKDETLGPFRSIGRYLAFGALGSLFVGFGAVLMLLGVLRYCQWQFRFLDGSESWLPYLIVVVIGIAAFALTIGRIRASAGRPRRSAK